jgi:hypothetical protein
LKAGVVQVFAGDKHSLISGTGHQLTAGIMAGDKQGERYQNTENDELQSAEHLATRMVVIRRVVIRIGDHI